MATVGVIAVLMAVAALGLQRNYADAEAAHQELINSVRELRLKASVVGAHYRLSPQADSYEIHRLRDDDGDGLWDPDPLVPARTVQLPPGVEMAALDLSGDDTSIEFDSRGVMVAADGAAAEVVHIVITDRDGESRWIEVWPSGQVQSRAILAVAR